MEGNTNYQKPFKTFVEREFYEGIEGEYDEEGFFNTPNGSFWDPDGVYFNREGYDRHGGYYDDNQEYIPGKGWDNYKNCYRDEIDDYNEEFDEYGSDQDEEIDDGFGDVNLDDIQDEEKLITNLGNDIEKVDVDPTKIEHKIEDEENYNSMNHNNTIEKEEPKEEKPKEEKKKSNLALLLESMNKDKSKNKKNDNNKKKGKSDKKEDVSEKGKK